MILVPLAYSSQQRSIYKTSLFTKKNLKVLLLILLRDRIHKFSESSLGNQDYFLKFKSFTPHDDDNLGHAQYLKLLISSQPKVRVPDSHNNVYSLRDSFPI